MTFEDRWKEFLARSSNPHIYNDSHRYLAMLGYTWAQGDSISLLQSALDSENYDAAASQSTKD